MAYSERLQHYWESHRLKILQVSAVVLLVIGSIKIGMEFHRLIFELRFDGAVDIRNQMEFTQRWFAGEVVYGHLKAPYPPASYPLLWPFLGWMSLSATRWVWAVTIIAVMLWLGFLTVRESGAVNRTEKAFVVAMYLSMNAVGITIGNGQITLHLLPTLITAILMMREPDSWKRDFLAAVLMVLCLVKPSTAVPFFWIILFLPRTMRPALFTVIGYVGLTLFAASFRQESVLELSNEWLASGLYRATQGGHGSLHSWMTYWGLENWNAAASLATLLVLGIWIYRKRCCDVWILLGVTAVVARVWTFHRMYDDALFLLAMIALFRIAKRASTPSTHSFMAGLLLAAGMIAMALPAGFVELGTPWSLIVTVGRALLWILTLLFLVRMPKESQEDAKKHEVSQDF